MTVFSEKVNPTFTSSGLNIIVVESYKEIFFDVFELEINGNKYVAEKVSERDGKPIVRLPIQIENKKVEATFVLEKGKKFEIFYNKQSKVNVLRSKPSTAPEVSTLIESVIEKSSPISVPDFQQVVDNFEQAKKSAAIHLEKIHQENIEKQKADIERFQREKERKLDEVGKNFKNHLISEFYEITENIKTQITQYNLAEKEDYNDQINSLFESFSNEIENKIDSNFNSIIVDFDNKIQKLTDKIFTQKLTSLIESKTEEIERVISANQDLLVKVVEEKIAAGQEGVNLELENKSLELNNLIDGYSKDLLALEKANIETNDNIARSISKAQSEQENINLKLEKKSLALNKLIDGYSKDLLALKEANIASNDDIAKSINKALSRIGNVKTTLQEKFNSDIQKLEKDLRNKLNEQKDSVKAYFNDKITILEDKFTDLDQNYRETVISLIRESENKILNEISSIDKTLPETIIVEAKGDNAKVSLESIRKELEGNISNKFSKEIISLKRLIEMTSGGGGGGGGGGGIANETDPIFTTWSQANSSNYESAYLTVQANSAGWAGIGPENDPIFTIWGQANSANYDLAYHTILTGGDVGGDLNLSGSLSADSIKFNLGAGILEPSQGEISWNVEDETLHFGMNGVTSRISQDQYMRVKADVAIKKGQAVRATGASGDGSGNITAALFSASSASGVDEIYFIGVAAEDMDINDFGFVSTFGKVEQVEVSDTRATDDPEYGLTAQNGWAIGTILYVSTTEPGKFTQTQPIAPNSDIPCVIIVSTNGTKRGFFVRYEHGYHLDEIHDVRYDLPLAEGDLLTWNNTTSAWTNRSETDPIFTTWVQANSSGYDVAYNTILTGGDIGGDITVQGSISATNITSSNIVSIESKIGAIYSYLIQNFENTYIATSVTLQDFVANEWTQGLNLQYGDVLLLSAANIAYVLGESDGSGVDNYFPVNLKPNFVFFKATLDNYSTLDSFPLSTMKSSKYVVQVEDTATSDVFYCELNVVSNGIVATVTEFGANYTTNEPFVEFGAETNGQIVSLTATGLGRDMNTFIFKSNRVNLF